MEWHHWMFKNLYSVNYPYSDKVQCHFLNSIQTFIFQQQFSMQTGTLFSFISRVIKFA